MKTRILILLLLIAAPLNAQKSDLSMTLRGIAAHDLHYPPAQMAPLITQGLSGSADEREAALYAIAGRSGILMEQTTENLAAWATNRSTLLEFRKQIEQIMISDSEPFVREAAVMALGGLAQRYEKDEWVTDLNDKDVAFLVSAFRAESATGVRADILRLVGRCRRCAASNLEMRKQLMRDAVYDSGVAELAAYGAAELKITDMLDYIATFLTNPDPGRRAAGAKALSLYGQEGARYRGALEDALRKEKLPEVRGTMEGAVSALDGKP